MSTVNGDAELRTEVADEAEVADELGGRRMAGRAVAAMGSQVANAGSSLALQLIAAHTLGLAGYGAFALCLAFMTSATGLYTGYVGDGLTVLDRHDARVRGGLAASAVVLLGVGLAGCIVLVFVLHLGGSAVALTYAVMVFGWLVEETGRRVLMARLEFWALFVNDAVYALVALAAVVLVLVLGHLTLLYLLAAMALGAFAAIAVATFQLPRPELRAARLDWPGAREVAGFSVWRALQASLRQTQLFVARVLLQQLMSLATVGAVEAGRLVVAPIQTLINAAASVLISTSAHAQRHSLSSGRRLANHATTLLVSATVVIGSAASVFAHPVGRLVTGAPVPPLLVAGWTVYLVTWAVTLPPVTNLVTQQRTRQIFNIRMTDTVIGLVALLSALLAGVSSEWTPWLLSIGGTVGATLILRAARALDREQAGVLTPSAGSS